MSAIREFTDALKAKRYRVPVADYLAWDEALRNAGDALFSHKDRDVRRALRAYRSKNVPPEFVSRFFEHNMGQSYSAIVGHREAIDAYVWMKREAIPDEYVSQLMRVGIEPADIVAFFGDNIAADYALEMAAA